MKKTDITVIILTKNEAVNIEKCIKSVQSVADKIYVIDSGSTDDTREIAAKNGAEVHNHLPFINHGAQFNWAIDNLSIDTTWIFRVDADEVITREIGEEIIQSCSKHRNDDVNAFEMRFKQFFINRFLKYGGAYPFCKINIFKKGKARFNERPLGDNIQLNEGSYIRLKNDSLHYDFKDLNAYIIKHNWYADLEVKSYFDHQDRIDANISKVAKLRKSIRGKIYYWLPKYFRAKLYYWFIYYVRLGFLDGEAGKIYAFIQAYFLRFVVDAKIFEAEVKSKQQNV